MQDEQLQGIAGLIDAKIDNDMKEVISELKRIEDKFDTRFNIMLWAMGILMAMMIAFKFFGK